MPSTRTLPAIVGGVGTTAIADYKAEGFSGGNDRLSAAAPEAVPFVLMLMRGPVARDPLAEAEEAEIVRPEPGRKALPAG